MKISVCVCVLEEQQNIIKSPYLKFYQCTAETDAGPENPIYQMTRAQAIYYFFEQDFISSVNYT